MLKLEILSLVNEYNKTTEHEREKILSSLGKIISEHESEIEDFYQSLDVEAQKILKLAFEKHRSSKTVLQNSDNSENDIEMIKKIYVQWKEGYINNGENVSDNETKLVIDLVNYYFPQKISVLNKILSIKFDSEFELFKNQLSNELRAKYAENIKHYIEHSLQKLTLTEKFQKKYLISKFLKKIHEYDFDHKMYVSIMDGVEY